MKETKEIRKETETTGNTLEHDIVVAVTAAIAPILFGKVLELGSGWVAERARKREAKKEAEEKKEEKKPA